jgi:hypothetical protein
LLSLPDYEGFNSSETSGFDALRLEEICRQLVFSAESCAVSNFRFKANSHMAFLAVKRVISPRVAWGIKLRMGTWDTLLQDNNLLVRFT